MVCGFDLRVSDPTAYHKVQNNIFNHRMRKFSATSPPPMMTMSIHRMMEITGRMFFKNRIYVIVMHRVWFRSTAQKQRRMTAKTEYMDGAHRKRIIMMRTSLRQRLMRWKRKRRPERYSKNDFSQ